jgi:RNA polymerase sigma-70 factor (ECF subfamily)
MPDDEAALLRAIHDEHGPALYRYVARLTRDYAFAEDVVQEALLRAWKRPVVLTLSTESTRAWLFTVARNLVIDDRRSARFAREVITDSLPEQHSRDETDAVLDKWLISDALLSLSPEHRAVIVNTYYLGRTAAEIGRTENIPDGTVRSRAHYALRALKIALQERGVTE